MALCRAGQAENAATADPVNMSADRVKRLKTLVQLRKLFRNLLRAERLLGTTFPVYQKPAQEPPRKGLQHACCHQPMSDSWVLRNWTCKLFGESHLNSQHF